MLFVYVLKSTKENYMQYTLYKRFVVLIVSEMSTNDLFRLIIQESLRGPGWLDSSLVSISSIDPLLLLSILLILTVIQLLIFLYLVEKYISTMRKPVIMLIRY